VGTAISGIIQFKISKGVARMAVKEQKEGIARVFDTLSATSIIAAVASLAGYGSIIARDVVLLCLAIPCLVTLSWHLRRI